MHSALCAIEADARKAGFVLPQATLDTHDNETFLKLVDQSGQTTLSCRGRDIGQAVVRLAVLIGRRQVLHKLNRLVEDVD